MFCRSSRFRALCFHFAGAVVACSGDRTLQLCGGLWLVKGRRSALWEERLCFEGCRLECCGWPLHKNCHVNEGLAPDGQETQAGNKLGHMWREARKCCPTFLELCSVSCWVGHFYFAAYRLTFFEVKVRFIGNPVAISLIPLFGGLVLIRWLIPFCCLCIKYEATCGFLVPCSSIFIC